MNDAVFTDIAASVQLAQEVSRRRTFAIISHPDAGKTTLTEKLLLYSGMVGSAGAVRPKKASAYATSDWMALEQARGISITSTALQFEHEGCLMNLLDTPGHQDFSEDTYRTLTAVDSAIMVLDAAKGVEPQTRKLFDVCRLRRIPILTFINKVDQPGRDPLELLDEIEKTLGIVAAPVYWPVGQGPSFQGLLELESRRVLWYTRQSSGQYRSESWEGSVDEIETSNGLSPAELRQFQEAVELVTDAGVSFSREAFLQGDMTPVYFGSALKNVGVDVFLHALADLAPSPRPRPSDQGLIDPVAHPFTGFVFKIQANMDPQHRDRMAFLRICSGRFEKDMSVFHTRLQRKIRMGRVHRLFARDRETLGEAFAGDIVGVVDPGVFTIGDTVCLGEPVQFEPVPRFQPEMFGLLRNLDVSRSKQFRRGVDQLEEEGVVQIFYSPDALRREPVVAAVGALQFDVMVSRLQAEYNVATRIDPLPYTCAAWIQAEPDQMRKMRWPTEGVMQVQDQKQRLVGLFAGTWKLDYTKRENPDIHFSQIG